jgi:heme-degrading monooxygenase HmoA
LVLDNERQRRTIMQHMRLATYGINKGSFQEIAETARTGMLPKFKEQPGFVRYGLADLGDKTCVSISVWETRQQAEAAAPVAATWVREHLADNIELRSNSVGDLAFFTGVPATV